MSGNELQGWLERLQHHAELPAIELKLERIEDFMQRLNNPQLQLPAVVHIAGTNGKGSTLAFIHAIMQAGGLSAHRYTSPHLVRFNERFIVANVQISDCALLNALNQLAPHLQAHPLTYFEATTALGFHLFAKNPADFTLLEVGMGGRFDATNIVPNPAITAITPVSLDHQEFLGDTISKIAFEKAGIIKAGLPCVVGVQHIDAMRVIEERANELQAPLFRHGVEWEFDILLDKSMAYRSNSLSIITPPPALLGAHQYQNAALAIACIDVLFKGIGARVKGLGGSAIQQGVASATWQGRLQQISLAHYGVKNQVFIDGGHNAAGADALVAWLAEQTQTAAWLAEQTQTAAWLQAQPSKFHLIMGLKADKDARAFIAKLAPFAASLRFVPIRDVACHSPLELLEIAHDNGVEATAYDGVLGAIDNILHDDKILICGSLYLIGEILELVEQ